MKVTIIGAGKLGTNITQALLIGGHEITVLDSDPALIGRIASRMDLMAVRADAQNVEVLRDINIGASDMVIACTDDDNRNMVLAGLAKRMGAAYCIARVCDPGYSQEMGTLMSAMNIDKVINPDQACANEIYDHLFSSYSFKDGIETIDGVAIMEFKAEKMADLAGRKLKDVSCLPASILIGVISRNGKIIIPKGDTEILPGDGIFAIGDMNSINELYSTVHDKQTTRRIENVMIAGGGKSGYFLADRLLKNGVRVSLIERDAARAHTLADILPEALITYGDASDTTLLVEEDLDDMDAFIACTGIDEHNMMLAMTAHQHGVKDIIAKVSRSNYSMLADLVGDIMIINPVELCTADIIRRMDESDKVVFSKTIQGQAEFTGIYVNPDMPMVNKTLIDLKLESGILIAAIHRNGDVIIPNGSTRILAGDRVIVLSMISKVPAMETLIKKGSNGEF